MAKWKDTIPLDPDDLKLLEADKLAHDIEGCFDQYDALIKIKKKATILAMETVLSLK